MRKIFLDLGLHNGTTIEIAIRRYPQCDLYIGIEPVPTLCEQASKRLENYRNKDIQIFNIAIDAMNVQQQTVRFFEDFTVGNHKLGSSLLHDKTLKSKRQIEVLCVDVNYFFNQTFHDGDKVILKIDIEGKEYDVLDALIRSKNLQRFVKKIWIEWHYTPKVPSISVQRHNSMVLQLQQLGYDVTGDSKKDEFYNGF